MRFFGAVKNNAGVHQSNAGQEKNRVHIKGTNTLDNAHIKIVSEGDPEGTGTRVSFDGAEGNTITVKGQNVIEEQLTVHSKTTFTKGDDNAHLRVNGWMTQTDLSTEYGGEDSDLSAVTDIPAPLEPITAAVAADLHYLAEELTDQGAYFQNLIANADGKVMAYSEELLEAFAAQIIDEKPDVLILPGDLTFNGEA